MVLVELVTLAPHNPSVLFTIRQNATQAHTHACTKGEISARRPGENESHDLNNSACMFLMRGLAGSRVREQDR